ncbi:hypothetical protein AQ505_18635 [Pedobacter sp. PACM 27299]|uniref:DUF6266 family protein n=1 Tax=Pedobacter sp. PACM 27299 TaxID=1727164 RepID=UPI00070666F7|nr:DUF6266 family protein [Pedobacter sp. PACM 27299]ALL07325.1 hypothetical protein AQ505_18635 [Pedobacter sp. PACM 27299]
MNNNLYRMDSITSLYKLLKSFKLITAGTDKKFYNAAVSYNKKQALPGSYPNISMDYTKALLSMGNLLTAAKTGISSQEDGIEFK